MVRPLLFQLNSNTRLFLGRKVRCYVHLSAHLKENRSSEGKNPGFKYKSRDGILSRTAFLHWMKMARMGRIFRNLKASYKNELTRRD